MHNDSYQLMSQMIQTAQSHGYLKPDQYNRIIDVGSQDVSAPSDTHLISGTYKPLFNSPFWEYKGVDITPGRNVDIVAPAIPWPIESNYADVVISGQTLEHTKAPWLWIKEIERVCKPSGLIMIIAPWIWDPHRYPVDCWRILPDGMTSLLSEWCNCDIMLVGMRSIDIIHGDCYAIAKKR